MAIKKCSPLLTNNPLCAIATYKDTINLETGATTRYIGKVVLTGESVVKKKSGNAPFQVNCPHGIVPPIDEIYWFCSHYPSVSNDVTWTRYNYMISFSTVDTGETENDYFRIRDTDRASYTAAQYSDYLAQQYANGTPVTIWYVLATPTTETVTVPTGSHGTVEGFLTQSNEPTPSNPVYPTANPVLVWNTIPYRKYGTDTDILTSFPADIMADGTSASVNIKGNLSQSGTPTPANPIYPTETGDKTANLIEFKNKTQNVRYVDITIQNGQLNFDGRADASGGRLVQVSEDIVLESGSYNLSHTQNGSVPSYFLQSKSDSTRYYVSSQSFALASKETFYISFNFVSGTVYNGTLKIMLNENSTALPYEPYGYKIPILSGGTTTNEYLGEVQSTRKIKKLVLTGEENVAYNTKNDNRGRFGATVPISITGTSVPDNVISSHLPTLNSTDLILLQTGICMRSTANDVVIAMSYSEVGITSPSDAPTIVDAVKTYLAQQYANGTPVCVWYVLATPTTGIVNEPIRKIGNYADSVSVTGIPTTGTAEQFDVQTDLKPSEVDLTYHGWHEHSDTKFTT